MKNKLVEQLHEAIRNARSFNEANYGLEEELYTEIKTAIDKYIEKNGNSFDLYADYNDTLSADTIAEIFNADRPLDAYYDIIGEWDWFENADEDYDRIFDALELADEVKEENKDVIMEMIRDSIYYNIPYDHFDATVGFDVYLNDPEGANVDYSENFLELSDDDEPDENGDVQHTVLGVNSTIKALLKTQGYTEKDFIDYYNENKTGNAFLTSLKEEIDEATYPYGQIVFLGEASILDMAKAIQDRATITVPVKCVCGITEAGQGSGSSLDIKLEKPVTGQICDMTQTKHEDGTFEVYYKDGYHYNVDEINGLVATCWQHKIEIADKEGDKE